MLTVKDIMSEKVIKIDSNANTLLPKNSNFNANNKWWHACMLYFCKFL